MSFELNLASLPNHILYIKGVQLSYIKVFVHIFNLWQAEKPCFLSNPELARRTQLHEDTVREAIKFFEKNNILKRIQKLGKRYLVQKTQYVEIEVNDGFENFSTNNDQSTELDPPGYGVRPPQGTELDPHNIKYNNKYNKSSCERSKKDQKAENQKRHDWADSKDQLAREQKHIEEHEGYKWTPISQEFKDKFHALTLEIKNKAKGA